MTCAASHGGGIIRSPRPEKAFEIVPHARIRDKNLTYRARGVLERLLSNSDGFAMSAEELAMESSREKRTAILTSLRELREAGYLVTRRSQNKRGQWITENLIFDTPQMLTSGAAEVRLPDSGRTGVGQPDHKGSRTSQKNQKQQHTRAARARVPADAGGAAASDSERPEQKARRERPSGLVTWYPSDAAQCERLERQTPAPELAAAVAATRAAGRDPVPGRIAAALLQRRQAAQSAAAAKQVDVRSARLPKFRS